MKTIYFVPVLLLAFACNDDIKQQNQQLLAQLDSLKQQTENDAMVGQQLAKVSALMDSIDKERNALRVNMETGIENADFEGRMKDIQAYIQQTTKRLNDISKSNSSYSALVKKLQQELKQKNAEITALQETVANYKQENEGLISEVNVKTQEIEDKTQLIMIKEQELALIEAKVVELMKQTQLSEAEALVARGEAMELAASRTKLAPKRKKETYQEALALYEKRWPLITLPLKQKLMPLKKS